MLKIITVCGLGVGSSLILKMTVDTAMSQLGVECDIEHWDMGTIQGQKCDLIVTTEGFRDNFIDNDHVVFVNNIMDVDEVKKNLEEFLNRNN